MKRGWKTIQNYIKRQSRFYFLCQSNLSCMSYIHGLIIMISIRYTKYSPPFLWRSYCDDCKRALNLRLTLHMKHCKTLLKNVNVSQI